MTATLHDLLKSYREGGVFPSYDQLAAIAGQDHIGAAVRGEAVADINFLCSTMDAQIWATEFCKLNNASDHGMMLSWFANAIMAGFDEANRRSARAADAPSEPSELPTTIRDGMHWPEGYVTDPNGKIIPPKGRYNDFKFGCDVGYGEGLASIKDTVANIGAQAVAKSRAADALDSQPTVSAVLAELRADLRELANNTEAFGEYSQEAARVTFDSATDALDEVAAKYATSQPTDGGVRNG